MRVRGLARSAFWAGIAVHLSLCHWAITSVAGDEPSAAAGSKQAVAGSVVLGFEADGGDDKGEFRLAKTLTETGNRFSAVMRGQEPEESPVTESPGLFAHAGAGLLEHSHGNCGCTGSGNTAGSKRVINSLFEMDSAQPVSVIRLRFDSAYDLEKPDRAEYFWGQTMKGNGPALNERSVDYQDFNYYMETALADGALAMFSEVPIRVLEPSVNDNTTGLADIIVGVKTVLIDHDECQVSTIFKTYIPSGLARRGLGTGHTSLEPGVLGRLQLDEQTWLHGELKFWFPIAGDPVFSGPVLRYGAGLSHVWCEWNTDSKSRYKAVIPTLEFVGWAVVDGKETEPNGKLHAPDPGLILNIQPGVRILCGQNKDIGFSSAFAVTNDHWYDELFRFEFRWFF